MDKKNGITNAAYFDGTFSMVKENLFFDELFIFYLHKPAKQGAMICLIDKQNTVPDISGGSIGALINVNAYGC